MWTMFIIIWRIFVKWPTILDLLIFCQRYLFELVDRFSWKDQWSQIHYFSLPKITLIILTIILMNFRWKIRNCRVIVLSSTTQFINWKISDHPEPIISPFVCSFEFVVVSVFPVVEFCILFRFLLTWFSGLHLKLD